MTGPRLSNGVSPTATLTREQVLWVRRNYTGKKWCKQHAHEFGISADSLYRAATGMTYTYVVETPAERAQARLAN